MKRTISISALFLLITIALHAQTPERLSLPGTLSYPGLYSALTGLELDRAKVAAVSNLTIIRDVANFTLASGKLYLCKPVAGRVSAALFVGDGSFSFVPPSDAERGQLRRFFKSDTMQRRVSSLFLLFADSTAEELARRLTFTTGEPPATYEDLLKDLLHYVNDEEPKAFADEFVRAFLNQEKSDLFYAHIASPGESPVFFEINPYVTPYDGEEVSFMRKGEMRVGSSFKETVCMFRRQGSTGEVGTAGRLIDVERYRIQTAIAPDLTLTGSAELRFKPLKDGARWIDLHLYPELRVDSIRWGNGTNAEFVQNGQGTIWLKNQPVESEAAGTLHVHYRGKLFERIVDFIVMKSSIDWYPHHDFTDKAEFDLIFLTPESYKLASIGRLISSEERDGVVTSRWQTDRPVRNASFGLGMFNEQKFTPDSVAPITVLRGPTSSGGVSEQIGWDLEHSIKFYEYLFGRLPVEHFYVTEIPAYHGEAFPGLIHLSQATFDRNDRSGHHEIFRAHEVAHQWWGIAVDFKTYHDQWLSEGFAEYAGLMYMQAVLKDNERFFKMLRDYKESIIENRKSIFGSGQEAGPIWLGYRTSSSSTQGDYDLIIYKKGAWVLHMLRNLLLDLQTMKEDRYRSAMREFYSTYRDKSATTEDFQRVIEKHAGMRLDWFFRQWVQGTDVPSYTYSYEVREAGGGKYKVALKVDQANVPDDFQMYVPVKIDFGDNRFARLRVLVKGPHSEPELPLMPLEPKDLVFNDLESVLCEVEED